VAVSLDFVVIVLSLNLLGQSRRHGWSQIAVHRLICIRLEHRQLILMMHLAIRFGAYSRADTWTFHAESLLRARLADLGIQE
jgi:hypothetical protein